ncbi:MAG: nucleotidyl transferase AbiEii/AbiGii toxin family protein [Propionibacteriaceae bacterium]|jgi:predicted nucleotidyltransferase component of viral defense system|nr:nucleotidyl transferase AbiEii/AbiGii toxin family protein [Propionibacteriaceae bacterium]
MIPAQYVTAWGARHPWPEQSQIEQDLLLSRAICAIASHPILGEELVFRGGTAFHKLHMPAPLRYSEDLDYVRATASGIGPLLTALRQVGEAIGFRTNSQVGAHPKVLWRTTTDDGVPLRIKIEMNTHERSPALPHIRVPFRVESSWWSNAAEVLSFQPPELVATKIRALYQRSKGRDLFDMWLALRQLNIDPSAILDAFTPYRPEGLTAVLAIANLDAKTKDSQFRDDITRLATRVPADYDIDTAAALVTDTLLSRLDG